MDLTAFFDLSYGMYLLGVSDGGRPTGCTANTVFQLTNEPLTLGVSLNRENYTNEVLKRTGRLTVNILKQDAPMDLIGLFGFRSGRDTDKFAQLPHHLTQSGLPVLDKHICGYAECRVLDAMELSTHTLFVLEAVDAARLDTGTPPMTYAYYYQVKKGTVPKTAPHYIPAEQEAAPPAEVWVCTLCGYEYDGAQGPFEDLPPDWTCPLCGAPKSLFVKKA